jgi:hypothetical protein
LRILLLLLISPASFVITAQANTEVFVVTLETNSEDFRFTALQNISNNAGYDNQPSFYNDNIVLFSSTRNGQTDIAAYALNKDSLQWRSETKDGSEYSPLKISGKKNISAIRLDTDGTQLLYEYDWDTGSTKELLKDLKVGYHLWYDPNIIISSVLVENRMDLVVSNLKDGTNYTFQKNVGRSLHKIPNSKLISFIGKEGDVLEIKSMDPISGATKKIVALPPGVQDICWLINGTILAGNDNQIIKFTPGEDNGQWKLLKEFPKSEISKISRIATNSISGKLTFVAEISGN